MGAENSPSNLKLNSNDGDDNNNVTGSSANSNAAVYDVICYYKEETEEDNDTVHAVIENIEKGTHKRRRQPVHRKFRLFGCMLIIILLSTPIYGFVTFYLHHREIVEDNFVLIWSPIIFNAVYLLVTPWLISDAFLSRFSNRNVILFCTFTMSMAISACGLIFVYFDSKFYPLIVLLYGIGGASACIIVGRMFVTINAMLNNERLYLINFIYSFSQGMTQFLLPIMIHVIARYFCADCTALILIGALTLHMAVITLLVMKPNEGSSGGDLLKINGEELKKFPIELATDGSCMESQALKSSSFDFYPDIDSSSTILDGIKWKNPKNFEGESNKIDECDDHFLEILDSHRVLDPNGVEILETIEEIDEEEGKLGMDEQINQKIDKAHAFDNSISFHDTVARTCKDFISTIQRQMVNPLGKSLKIFKFYSSVILKSVDVFSYLLFVTLILPNQALRQLRFENVENVIYLITLMGICWLLYSIAVLKFHKVLKQNFIHYFHLLGMLAKFFGYLFTNQRYSLNGFIFGIILISMGHANCLHLQETVIRNCFHPRHWHHLRGSIYSFSGFLIFVYCIIFHLFHSYFTFVTFANIFVLFNLLSLLIWIFSNFDMVIIMCNMR